MYLSFNALFTLRLRHCQPYLVHLVMHLKTLVLQVCYGLLQLSAVTQGLMLTSITIHGGHSQP